MYDERATCGGSKYVLKDFPLKGMYDERATCGGSKYVLKDFPLKGIKPICVAP
jgi:hypothetical protein